MKARLFKLALLVTVLIAMGFMFTMCRAIHQITKKLTPVEKERLAMELVAAQWNAAQTNWTMIVVVRTNTVR